MEYFAGLDVSMEQTHVCVLDRDGAVVHEARVATAAETIAEELTRARRLAGLAIATSWLSGCATGGSDPPVTVCPPVVEYSAEFRVRAAGKLELLPEDSAIVEMLGDYAVIREQARGCRSMQSGRPTTLLGGGR